eukprot:GILJ01018824.1.p3 GENE.GILJ01018824.1~~GILJ01018824.1.p3  ORF type:complete len:289 (+),score=44.91 GILJ01018824.1:2579-3445(+)
MDLVQRGDDKLKRRWWDILTPQSVRLDEALDLYRAAINKFKMERDWNSASTTLMKCINIKEQDKGKDKDNGDLASLYLELGNLGRHHLLDNRSEAYERSAALFAEQGAFNQAAKAYRLLGELCESSRRLEEAVIAYQKASDMFLVEQAVAASCGVLIKVADLSAELENYERAVAVYERLAQDSVDNTMFKYQCTSYFFKAALSRLAHNADTVGMRAALERYIDLFPTFSTSREYELLVLVAAALDNGDTQAFTDHVFQFDGISKLSPLTTQLLLKIKSFTDASTLDLS